MNEQEIFIRGNTLIAEFMGLHRNVFDEEFFVNSEWPDMFLADPAHMKYHTSWDWLMPVLEKIEGQGNIVEISLCLATMCRIVRGSFKQPVKTIATYTEQNKPILAAWQSVVEYIKWYNEQQPVNDQRVGLEDL